MNRSLFKNNDQQKYKYKFDTFTGKSEHAHSNYAVTP